MSLEELTKTISKLPGLGPRSARRIIFELLKNKEHMLYLSSLLKQAHDEVTICSECGNVDIIDPCNICANEDRDKTTVCVVENISDLWALERTNSFKGIYHVLGGTLSVIAGRTPEKLNIDTLKLRASNNNVEEIIIATNATLEGQTTAHYIMDILSDSQAKVTCLAHGIPMGAQLDYMDDGTLSLALKMRNKFA